MAAALLETAGRWEKDGGAAGEVREMSGAVAAPFLEQMLLVFQDVPTGDSVHEAVADDRTDATGKAVVEARLTALGPEVWSLVRDRAKALIPLAEKGLECLSMPDVVPVIHAIVKRYALALGRCVRHAHHALQKAAEARGRLPDQAHAAPDRPAAQAAVEAKRAEGRRWEAVQRTYRQQWETLSLSRPPCGLADAAPQTSAQVESPLQAAGEAIEA